MGCPWGGPYSSRRSCSDAVPKGERIVRNTRLSGLVASLLFLFVSYGQAHHAVTVHFNPNAVIEIRGVVVEFRLQSPHSLLIIDGTAFIDGIAQSDVAERWEVEGNSTPIMRRADISQDSFQAGANIRVVGWQNRDPEVRFMFGNTYITDNAVFGEERVEGYTSVADENAGIQRIAGRWRSPGYLNGPESPLPLNEAGLAAWRAYDPRFSPAVTCESQSIPGVFHAPYIFDVQVNGQEVVLHNEAYSITRTVEVDGEESLANPGGIFGVARARVEDGSLVVESRDYPSSKWGLGIATHLNGGGADVPSSEQKTVVERYSVSPDGQTLVLDYTLYDPVYLTEPHVGRFELARVADDTPIYSYECDIESAGLFTRQLED